MKRALFLFVLLLIGVYAGTASAQMVPQLTESYTTDSGLLTIRFPSDWTVMDDNAFILTNEAIVDVVEADDEIPPGYFVMTFIEPALLPNIGLDETANPMEALDTLFELGDFIGDIVRYDNLGVNGASAYVTSLDVRFGQLVALQFETGTVVVAIEFGSDFQNSEELYAANVAHFLGGITYNGQSAADGSVDPSAVVRIETAETLSVSESQLELTEHHVIDDHLSVDLPEGWIIASEGATLALASSQSAWDTVRETQSVPGGELVIQIIQPGMLTQFGQQETAIAAAALSAFMNGANLEGAVQSFTGVSLPASYARVSGTFLPDGLLIGVEFDRGTMLFAAVAGGDVEGYRGDIAQIISSVQYDGQAAGSAGEAAAQLVVEEIRQWARAATGTSQYGTSGWSFLQATGAPNTDQCGDVSTAWASSSSRGVDHLVLTFDQAVVATQVNIHQTYNPGSIIKVELTNIESGEVVELPNSADPPGNTSCPGVFTVDVSGVDSPMNGVVIYFDQTIGGGWNEIDAVELVGLPEGVVDTAAEPTVTVAANVSQWANYATGSSQYGEQGWSFMQATGEPDADDVCGDSLQAWASSGSTSSEILALEFEQAVIPSQVNVYQVYNPGSIVRVELTNTDTSTVIPMPNSADPPGNTPCPGVFTLDISGVDTPVNGVILYLDQSIGGSWNEIDAVELIGSPEGATVVAAPTKPAASAEAETDDLETMLEAALTTFGSANYDDAIAQYDAILEIDPENGEAYYYRAYSYFSNQDYEPAIEDFTRVLEYGFDQDQPASVLTLRGLSYRRLGRLDEALRDFDEAISLRPNSFAALSNRAGIYEELRDWNAYLENYETLVGLDPASHTYHNGAAWGLVQLGRYEEALEAANRSLEIEPDYGSAVDTRGWAYLGLGDFEAAEADFERAIELGVDYSYYGLGELFYLLGEDERALENLRIYAESAGDNIEQKAQFRLEELASILASTSPTEVPADAETAVTGELDVSEFFSFDGENRVSLYYPVGWVTDVSQLPAIASNEDALATLQRGADLPEGGIAIGIIPPKDMPGALGITPTDSAEETLGALADLLGVEAEITSYEGLTYPAYVAAMTGTRMLPPNTHALTFEHGNGVVTFLIVAEDLDAWDQLIEELVASFSMS